LTNYNNSQPGKTGKRKTVGFPWQGKSGIESFHIDPDFFQERFRFEDKGMGAPAHDPIR